MSSPRRDPPRPWTRRSGVRSERLTAQLGLALAVAFLTCLVTGLISHLIQHPPGWFGWPSRPVQLYRVTQGLHVATGLASVPLLVAKLWSVYPNLFRWPPVRGLGHALERAGIAVLVAAALFELVTGILNITHRYSLMPFGFPSAHYRTALLLAGALLVHIGVTLPITRRALTRLRHPPPAAPPHAAPPPDGSLTRRGLFGAVAAASGLITVATAGQTVTPLAPVSLLAPRRPGTGPQRVPVNTTARAAGVHAAALDPRYRLLVTGPTGELRLSLADLAGLPQHPATLPIVCVEGWSTTATWQGVRLRDLAELVGADPGRGVALVESLQTGGAYRSTLVPPPHLRDPLTLIALRLGGEPLHLDHGYPARLIAPNRPGVQQTKWVARITMRAAR